MRYSQPVVIEAYVFVLRIDDLLTAHRFHRLLDEVGRDGLVV
jgi:hypothetical protein